MFLKKALKDQKLALRKRPQSSILLWGVIFQMAPNHVAEPVWKWLLSHASTPYFQLRSTQWNYSLVSLSWPQTFFDKQKDYSHATKPCVELSVELRILPPPLSLEFRL